MLCLYNKQDFVFLFENSIYKIEEYFIYIAYMVLFIILLVYYYYGLYECM